MAYRRQKYIEEIKATEVSPSLLLPSSCLSGFSNSDTWATPPKKNPTTIMELHKDQK